MGIPRSTAVRSRVVLVKVAAVPWHDPPLHTSTAAIADGEYGGFRWWRWLGGLLITVEAYTDDNFAVECVEFSTASPAISDRGRWHCLREEDRSMAELTGKRAVITHANAFMGPDIATLLKENGAEVVADSDPLTSPTSAADLVERAGRVDILVANLSYRFTETGVLGLDEDEMQQTFAHLIFPLHRLVAAVLPQMLERRAGKIVVVGSASGLRASPDRALYGAARAAQHGYVRNVGLEVAPHNIQLNATGQSFVENDTYFSADYQRTEAFRRRLEGCPAGRLATGREAAELILFLAGPRSDFFVGQVIPFAGGFAV